jgi:hypothetical protein
MACVPWVFGALLLLMAVAPFSAFAQGCEYGVCGEFCCEPDDPPPDGGGGDLESPIEVAGQCFWSVQAAAEHVAQSRVGELVEIGGYTYTISVVEVAGPAITWAYTPLGPGPYPESTTWHITWADCTQSTPSDALALGALVMSAWASIFAIKFMARAMRQRAD